MKIRQLCKKAFSHKYNIRYEKEIRNHTMSYQQWLNSLQTEKSVAFGEEKSGDLDFDIYIAPCGTLEQGARERLAEAFARNPQAWLIYGDDDISGPDGVREKPYFKPDWSPDLLEDSFYLGGVVAIRKLGAAESDSCNEMDRQWIRKQIREKGIYEKGTGRKEIFHLPEVLFHYSDENSRTEWMKTEQGRMVEYEGMEYDRIEYKRLEPAFSGEVSVIIPSKDNPGLLRKCIDSILRVNQTEAGPRLSLELIVVDNGSDPDNKREIESYLNEIRKEKKKEIHRVLYCYKEQPFNFSSMCNTGARMASGNCLLFLNDDVELTDPGCLEKMAVKALRPFTGAVGVKLLYPERKAQGLRIQHAGIVNLPMGPVHKLQFCQDSQSFYFGWNHKNHNVLAVTAACLMLEKKKFVQVGGLDETLKVAFNDVDLCYSLYEAGYENVCLCDFYAYHDESYSRGDDESPEKLERLLGERDRLYEKHPALEGKDPYFAEQLSREGLDTRIRPAYEIQGNHLQYMEKAQIEVLPIDQRKTWREDACLMVRVESVLNGKITGWSVVLGDNNACYDKYLILIPQKKDSNDGGIFYRTKLIPQYRPDLIENMPDQSRVGLSGFWFQPQGHSVPSGEYSMGILAVNRVNGVKLYNQSNRKIEIASSGNEEV